MSWLTSALRSVGIRNALLAGWRALVAGLLAALVGNGGLNPEPSVQVDVRQSASCLNSPEC